MKKISLYIIICIIIILLRNNICFFISNIFGVFKLDNNYYEGIIKLKDEEIKYLNNEIDNINEFSKKLPRIKYNYKVSKIIYKESYNIGKYKVQYGKKDKVSIGSAVMNEYGLIGKITKVDESTSELTTLKNLKDISVVINGIYGKLNYDYKNNKYVVTDISNYDKVYINNEVYTSGYGTIKENIYIGKVIKVENDTISKKVYIDINDNYDNLNYLLIVGDF